MVAYRSFASFRYIPTVDARARFGPRLGAIAADAFRAIARAGKGFEVSHLQFHRGADLVAVSSRVRASGEIEIEIGVGNPRLPSVVFTEEELKSADRHTSRPSREPRGRSARTLFHLSR
jgi:hypothetical protein